MIEINISENLDVIGWIFVAFVHFLFVIWFNWSISEHLKDRMNGWFEYGIFFVLPVILVTMMWLMILSVLGHIVWL